VDVVDVSVELPAEYPAVPNIIDATTASGTRSAVPRFRWNQASRLVCRPFISPNPLH